MITGYKNFGSNKDISFLTSLTGVTGLTGPEGYTVPTGSILVDNISGGVPTLKMMNMGTWVYVNNSVIATDGSKIIFNSLEGNWEVSNDGGNTFFPLVQSNFKSYYVAASNPSIGDGSITNPYQTLDQAINYIIDNSLQGLGYTINILDGIHTTTLNYAQGVALDFTPFSGIDYTGTGYLFTDIGYNFVLTGNGIFTCPNGGFVYYGGPGRFQLCEFASVTSLLDCFNFGQGTFGYSTVYFNNGAMTTQGSTGCCIRVNNFDLYENIYGIQFTATLGMCYTGIFRTTTTFDNCSFGAGSSNTNALVYVPNGSSTSTFYYINLKRCYLSIGQSNKCIQVDDNLTWGSSSQQLLWLEGNRFACGYRFGTVTPPLYTDYTVQYVGILNSLQNDYATNYPGTFPAGSGTFVNIATPTLDQIIINN